MLVVKRSLLHRGLGHERILDVSPVEASRASSTVLAAMSFLDKLERRLGFIAIPGLIRAIVTLNALVFILVYLNKGFDSYLALDVTRIRDHWELWRLVTYIFVPQTAHPLIVLIALWFLWFIGDGLERAWGPFRLTLYFLVGMVGTTVAAVLSNSQFSNQMLFTTLFFAFAHFYPDEIIYVFFILPLKIKWIAWAYAAFLLLAFVTQSNSYRLALIAALSTYLIFFGPGMIQHLRQRKEVAVRRNRFEIQARSDEEPLHRCATCGATELTDPSLEFRVARDGEEYCLAHLPRPVTAPISSR
jgi:membrane associated rhomboid family serine protease